MSISKKQLLKLFELVATHQLQPQAALNIALGRVPFPEEPAVVVRPTKKKKLTVVKPIVVDTRPEVVTLNRFANEEVASSYKYPDEYKGPMPIVNQIKAIAKIFGLDPSYALEFAKNLPALPDGAEGWFAIPSVDALAKKHFPEVIDPAEQYCQAVQLVLAKIADSRSFYNYNEGQITPAQLRLSARTAHALDLIAETQEASDLSTGQAGILIVAAQLGMRHRSKSVRQAREVFVANEFGLGSLAVGSIVLTHPERLVHCEICSGDEFSLRADGDFSWSPCFYFSDGKVRFDARFVGFPYDRFGSVSGFLLQ